MSFKIIATAVSMFLLMTPADAFFRHLCFNPLGFGRVDPIMSPGVLSQHVHHLHGSGNLGIQSTDADYLIDANCTSCSILFDKSAYWAPAMYFHHTNGTFELMTTSSAITIYYKTEKRVNFEDRNYTAFPKGFRMVAGENTKRKWVGPWPVPEQSIWGPIDTTQEALASKAMGFNCLNYHRHWDEATFAYPYLRAKEYIDEHCSDGLRAEILFPSCWDGVNFDSTDHKSHVAYPTLLQDGACPKTHPVFLPVLFYETIWNTQAFKGLPGQFIFSNGDPTGYGYHADFIAAWEDGILEAVIADPNCTDHILTDRHTDGIQEHCPVFANHIQSQEDAAKCKLELTNNMAHERVVGQLDALPGNVEIIGQRHDPGNEPDDYDSVGISPIASPPSAATPSVATPVQSSDTPAKPSDTPVVTSPVTTTPIRPSSIQTPASTTVVSLANSTITPSASPTVIQVTSTTTFKSNGANYVMVIVEQVVTVTSVIPVHGRPDASSTVARNESNPILSRKHHRHGHIRHNMD